MAIYLDDVAFWTQHWSETGDLIPEPVARRIAEYWQSGGDDSTLAEFARGFFVEGQAIRDDIAATIQYAKMAMFTETILELYALKDWVLHNL